MQSTPRECNAIPLHQPDIPHVIHGRYYLCCCYAALRLTGAVVERDGQRVTIKHPDVYFIPRASSCHQAALVQGRMIAASLMARYSSAIRGEEAPRERIPEETYMPDALGYYLPKDAIVNGVQLPHGIYILLPNILNFVSTNYAIFRGDPDLLYAATYITAGTVFYHEYMHYLIDVVGASGRDPRSSMLEEVACEWLAANSTLNISLGLKDDAPFILHPNILYVPLSSNYLGLGLMGYDIHVLLVSQYIDRGAFLLMPRPEPYSYVSAFSPTRLQEAWKILRLSIEEAAKQWYKPPQLPEELKPRVYLVGF